MTSLVFISVFSHKAKFQRRSSVRTNR